MKIQDLIFLLILIIMIRVNHFRITVAAALICLLISVPLFWKWFFFTAERMTWYAGAFILLGIIQVIFFRDDEKKE